MSSFIISVLGIAMAPFVIWMLIDCVLNEDDRIERVSWVILMLVAGFIGAPAYFVRCYLPRRRKLKESKGVP